MATNLGLNPQQIKEAQDWIQNQGGYGSFDPQGKFTMLTGGMNSETQGGQGILGAAQAMGYSDADVSQILNGAYGADQIGAFRQANASQVDGRQNQFEVERSRAAQPAAQGGNLGFGTLPSQPAQPAQPQAQPQAQQGTAPGLRPYEKNPYLDEMAGNITGQMNDNWSRNIQPSMRSGAMAAGGFGGSRQGVVEANGLNDMNRSLSQNLSNLYGQDYQQQQGRNMQEYQGNQGYDLGLRNNDLGFAGLDYNIDNSNFNHQLQSANFGLNVQNQLQGNNAAGVAAGTAMQNTPLNYYGNFANQANSIGQGYGTTSGNSSVNSQSSPLMGALGGWELGSQYGNRAVGGGGSISQTNQDSLDSLGASNNWWGTGR